jgi:hypothetical protein
MGLKSRQATMTAKAGIKSNTAKKSDTCTPPGVMEGVLTPRVPMASDGGETSSLTPY